MYKIDNIGGLFMSMPPNLQTKENEAMCYAIDRQIAKLSRLARKLNVWSNLDNADPAHYDQMATTANTPYYRSDMTDEQKLNLIKNTPQTKKYLGTVKGVTDYLSTVFDDFELIPWYEYGGSPYHFKVRAAGDRTPEIDETFSEILRKVKAARSYFDTVESVRNLDEATAYNAVTNTSIIYAPELSE